MEQSNNQQDNTKSVTTINTEQKDKKDKRLTLLIVLISVGTIIGVLLIIFAVILGLYRTRKNGSGSTDTSFVVSEDAEDRYANLLSYINKERTSAGLSNATDIVSLDFKNHDLYVSYQNETEPGFIRIETSYVTFDECISSFTESVPSVGTYGVEINMNMTYNTEKAVNVDGDPKVGYVCTFLGNDYLSATYVNQDGSLSSLTKTAYLESGNYPEGVRVNKSQDLPLYELLYYILFK